MHTIGTWQMWLGFAVLLLVAVTVDLRVMQRRGAHRVRTREALGWSLAWVGLALAFNLGLWVWLLESEGRALADRVALEFLTGYLVEKSLAVDNIFVFLMLFGYFAVPAEQQQRVLVYGVLGALVLRALMIFAGAALVAEFHWVLYLFGAFLAATGVKMLLFAGKRPDLEKNPLLRWLSGRLRLSRGYDGDRFVTRIDGVRHFTPLFLVMVMVGVTDAIFAVDSIPAIFAITHDPFVVLTSNLFAVLGLRALYFLFAGMADRFHLLGYGLGLVLLFVGAKMLVADWYEVPVPVSLAVVASTIATAMLLSLWLPPRRQRRPGAV